MAIDISGWRHLLPGAAAIALLTTGAAAQKAPPSITDLDAQPIAAGELHAAYFHWNGEMITVAGYPALFMSPTPWKKRVGIGSAPEENTPSLATCMFIETPQGGGDMESAVGLVVGGRFDGRTFSGREGQPPKIELRDCELVSTGEAMPTDSDPWTIGDAPIGIDALHEAVFGWQGQKVKVVGYFNGTTYSSANDTTRHDLQTGQSGPAVVGCNQAGDVQAPEAASANRAGVVMEGTIGEPIGDKIILEDCRFIGP